MAPKKGIGKLCINILNSFICENLIIVIYILIFKQYLRQKGYVRVNFFSIHLGIGAYDWFSMTLKVGHFNMRGVKKFEQLKFQMSNVHRAGGC